MQNAFASNGKSINTLAKYGKNLKNDTVKAVRLGVSDDTAVQSAFSNWQTAYVNYLVANNATSRRKRQTCTQKNSSIFISC